MDHAGGLKTLDEQKEEWEWAAGINQNPYKQRRFLRDLASDHAAVTPCRRTPLGVSGSTVRENLDLLKKKMDLKKGIAPFVG